MLSSPTDIGEQVTIGVNIDNSSKPYSVKTYTGKRLDRFINAVARAVSEEREEAVELMLPPKWIPGKKYDLNKTLSENGATNSTMRLITVD
jgi:hypothetical protein